MYLGLFTRGLQVKIRARVRVRVRVKSSVLRNKWYSGVQTHARVATMQPD